MSAGMLTRAAGDATSCLEPSSTLSLSVSDDSLILLAGGPRGDVRAKEHARLRYCRRRQGWPGAQAVRPAWLLLVEGAPHWARGGLTHAVLFSAK
jgi:hypothetical protein